MATTLPDALLVGPQRSGTTWAYRYLGAHPEVGCPTRVKETFFFDREFDRGLDWYQAFFEDRGQPRTVEVAPSYFHHPLAPSRVFRALGPIPIVVTLRDPLDRIRSLYFHLLRYGEMKTTDFADALRDVPVLLDSSRYAHHVERWRAACGAANVHVLLHDDLEHDPAAYVRGLTGALGIAPVPVPAALDERVNRTAVPRHRWVAALASGAAARLRALGLHELVLGAKRMGFKEVLMGRSDDASPEPELDLAPLAPYLPQLRDEVERIEALIARDLSSWKRRLAVP
jgi:hypothetical protein